MNLNEFDNLLTDVEEYKPETKKKKGGRRKPDQVPAKKIIPVAVPERRIKPIELKPTNVLAYTVRIGDTLIFGNRKKVVLDIDENRQSITLITESRSYAMKKESIVTILN